jgi:hypothetical protein
MAAGESLPLLQCSAGVRQLKRMALGKREKGKQMDVHRREKIRMLMRILETIHQEVSQVLSEEEDNLAHRSGASKEAEAGQISEEPQRNLEDACAAIENALDLMQVVVGGDGKGI